MMPAWFAQNPASNSLQAQIRDAERRVSNRQQSIEACKIALIGNIHRRITAPASLALAVGIGFIAGELGKCPKRTLTKPTADQGVSDPTPIRTALNLLLMVHTLYTALPVVWLTKRFKKSRSSKRASN